MKHQHTAWSQQESLDKDDVEEKLIRYLRFREGRGLSDNGISPLSAYKATATSVQETLIDRARETQKAFEGKDVKEVAYLSLEFLIGRSLQNAIYNLELTGPYAEAVKELGHKLEDIYEQELDAGLGNGGLGRLAACFMDSLATLNLPGMGYGLRYKYGIFAQRVIDGYQVEFPDPWLRHGNPWEVERSDISYPVRFYGELVEIDNKFIWRGGEVVRAVAYDTLIPGYKTHNTISIRLWSARSDEEFDLGSFNQGNHEEAFRAKERAESITSVLYPNDNHESGKELRLKQQYLFVSATLQDLLRRFKHAYASEKQIDFSLFPKKFAIQLNDTHPTLGIPELIRLLVDVEGVSFLEAWAICRETFAYTNHTVLPEALEKWSVALMGKLLPRHMKIIYDINYHFLSDLKNTLTSDVHFIRRVSIIEEEPQKSVKMASLAVVGSRYVNGVAAIHSGLVKTDVFPDYYSLWPNKFQNKTNGVTPRRWLGQCNPGLKHLITTTLGNDNWILHLDELQQLRKYADDHELQEKWLTIKRENKQRLIEYLKKENPATDFSGIRIDGIFDIQIKRIHEYKRQLLNILGVMHRYRHIKSLSAEEKKRVVPRLVLFSGKAAPGYHMAKLIIKLANNLSEVVNNDKEVGDLLKVYFVPGYSVTLASVMIPASDLSQQTSTAGMEASGTGNMKFAMNGSLIIGTLDGANIEIRDEIGHENMFIFGAKAEEVEGLRHQVRDGSLKPDKRFEEVLSAIKLGIFGDAATFERLIASLENGNDYYLLGHDFATYLEAQERVDKQYTDKHAWAKSSILSTAGSGVFSSDRTIAEYAKAIWDIKERRIE